RTQGVIDLLVGKIDFSMPVNAAVNGRNHDLIAVNDTVLNRKIGRKTVQTGIRIVGKKRHRRFRNIEAENFHNRTVETAVGQSRENFSVQVGKYAFDVVALGGQRDIGSQGAGDDVLLDGIRQQVDRYGAIDHGT